MKKSLKFCFAAIFVLFGTNHPSSASEQSVEFKEPTIRPDETIYGTQGAPLILVKYSDFECPYCVRGFQTVKALLKKYEGKIQFVYKHFPFKPNAMIASKYYEGIRLQDEEKALQFHDEIYRNQPMLQNGESFLQSLAQKLNVDMKKLAQDIHSPAVQNRIKEDMDEAVAFGVQGTPSFVLNGVLLIGAHPMKNFDLVIQRLVELGLVAL